MIEMDRKGKLCRLKLFLDIETYAYIKDISDYRFHGFVVEIGRSKIMFMDDKLGNIPIRLKDIKKLTYSRKKIQKEME